MRLNYDIAKIIHGFTDGFVFGSALGIPVVVVILLAYWVL